MIIDKQINKVKRFFINEYLYIKNFQNFEKVISLLYTKIS